MRHLRRVPASDVIGCLEGRFGIRAVAPTARVADTGGSPRVLLRCRLAAAPVSTGVATLVCTSAPPSEPPPVRGTEPAAGARGAVDLGRCVTQARSDFIDFELNDGALFAFFGFVGTALQATGNDDAHPLGE